LALADGRLVARQVPIDLVGVADGELERQTDLTRMQFALLGQELDPLLLRPGQLTQWVARVPPMVLRGWLWSPNDTIGHMRSHTPSIQRSFRLSARTLELLDELAAARDLSRNAVAEQLLGEAVRTDRHPLIRFREGGSGRRRPALIGTRLDVHDVIATLRGEDGSVEAAAEYLDVDVRSVRAALAYYADFADEVDRDIETAAAIAQEERARWDRQQRALR
jgi:uncharacterized protein (DUF433 family)